MCSFKLLLSEAAYPHFLQTWFLILSCTALTCMYLQFGSIWGNISTLLTGMVPSVYVPLFSVFLHNRPAEWFRCTLSICNAFCKMMIGCASRTVIRHPPYSIKKRMRHYYTSSPWDHGYFWPRGSFDAAQGPLGPRAASKLPRGWKYPWAQGLEG